MTPNQKISYERYIQEIEKEMEKLYEQIYPANEKDLRLETILHDIENGKRVLDTLFDRIFPHDVRRLSAIHWTPIEITKKAISLMSLPEGSRVLDIGSGCGKFCLVAAIIQPQIQFFGIEQRSHLVVIAKQSAKTLGLKNTHFQNGNMTDLNWNKFDAFYFYNPFGENTLAKLARIDSVIPVNLEQYYFYIDAAKSKLSSLKKGTKVVTYHGFGGTFPEGYEVKYSERYGTGELELWERV